MALFFSWQFNGIRTKLLVFFKSRDFQKSIVLILNKVRQVVI